MARTFFSAFAPVGYLSEVALSQSVRSEISAGGKVFNLGKEKILLISSLFSLSSSEGCDAGPERRRILICIKSFTTDLILGKVELLTPWILNYSILRGKNNILPASKPAPALWKSVVTLETFISFQGGSTTFIICRCYLPNLTMTSSTSHTVTEIQSNSSGRRSCV